MMPDDTEDLRKNRVLIVDDESPILLTCTHILEKQFRVDAAESGAAALGMIRKRGGYAVIIADLRMPGMDGMTFLSHAKKIALESEFIIQTGYADRGTITKAVKELGVSRILVKPCDRRSLIAEVTGAVERYTKKTTKNGQTTDPPRHQAPAETCCRVQETLVDRIRSIVSELKFGRITLPVVPEIIQELQRVEKDPDAAAEDLAAVIEKDPALSLGIIKAAGSYLYRGRSEVLLVKDAIFRLGTEETLNVAATIAHKSLYNTTHHRLRHVMKKLWLHSLCCAYGARSLAERMQMAQFEKCFLMGLIHDIGKVLILRALDEKLESGAEVNMQELIEGLQEHHASVGGILLRNWRFPKEFISVATLHEDPLAFPLASKTVWVVHLANLLTRKTGYSLYAGDIDLGATAVAKKLGVDADDLDEIYDTVIGQMEAPDTG
jgi:HD-like signal output (HDOD) protein/ActR/RegA family two-component response regulator